MSTGREWHENKKWYVSGWASDPSQWSQYPKRAKPIRSDPSDDQRSYAAMPSGFCVCQEWWRWKSWGS